MGTVKYVLADHADPKRLHRMDCPHPTQKRPTHWRLATRRELRTLDRCADCDRKDRA